MLVNNEATTAFVRREIKLWSPQCHYKRRRFTERWQLLLWGVRWFTMRRTEIISSKCAHRPGYAEALVSDRRDDANFHQSWSIYRCAALLRYVQLCMNGRHWTRDEFVSCPIIGIVLLFFQSMALLEVLYLRTAVDVGLFDDRMAKSRHMWKFYHYVCGEIRVYWLADQYKFGDESRYTQLLKTLRQSALILMKPPLAYRNLHFAGWKLVNADKPAHQLLIVW